MRSDCDRLSKLPDDILCDMLSYLTLRDAARTRLLSSRWRYLPYCHSILQFDAFNVFGIENCNTHAYKSRFAMAVEQVLEQWRGQNLSSVRINFLLGYEFGLHIHRWIQSAVNLKIKELDLNLSSTTGKCVDKQVFYCGLLLSESASYLKCLSLTGCVLSLPFACELTLSSGCMNWISQLSTLHLSSVPLRSCDMDHILCGGLNLTSLTLDDCCHPSACLNVELPYLKMLVIHDTVWKIALSCPNLDFLDYSGRKPMHIQFPHVPRLREVRFSFCYDNGRCVLTYLSLTKYVPTLQRLSLCLTSLVPPLVGCFTFTGLKRLDLLARIPCGLDACSIIYFLKACPFLERLHLKEQNTGRKNL